MEKNISKYGANQDMVNIKNKLVILKMYNI